MLKIMGHLYTENFHLSKRMLIVVVFLSSALVRSIVKNFSMAFFFPACLTVFFFRFNRAAYDVLAHTVVVEVERQQRQQE